MITTFGEVKWEDDVPGVKKGSGKDIWLRLNAGSNEMRLLTKPHQYLIHKVKKDESDKKDFGQKVSCSAIHGSCPLCDSGDEPKARWLLGVISRATQTYQILDISSQVFNAIKKLNAGRWGDPTKYDIDIIVDKAGGPTGYYSVQPVEKTPLSAADQIIRDNDLNLDELKRKVTPYDVAGVIKRVSSIKGFEWTPKAKTSVDSATAVAPVSMTDEDAMDEEFPAHAG